MKFLLYAIFICLCLASNSFAGFEEGLAAYNKQDYATALREFRLMADQGHADAQYNLGYMYANGQGVKQDYADAVSWYLVNRL